MNLRWGCMRRYGIICLMLILLAHGGDVRAAPLDAEQCAKLKTELAELEQAGVRASMAKGPAWGKANLAPDKLDKVRRLVEVDEQLLFRCQGKPLVLLPAETELELTEGTAGKEDANEPVKAGTDKKKVAPAKADKGEAKQAKPDAAAKKAATAAKMPSGKETGSAKHEKQKPAVPKTAKVKPKQRVNDAYQPPPGDPDKPFASQLVPTPGK